MRSLLAYWSIDDRPGTVQWRWRTLMQTPHRLGASRRKKCCDLACATRASAAVRAWLLRSPKCSLPFPFKHLSQAAILDSHTPNQYGPRGFGGGIVVILLEPARVSQAWPTTHARKVIANNRPPTRLHFPRGSSVWASDSATSMPIILPKAVRSSLHPPIRPRWPEVFGFRPNSSPLLWLARRSVGCSTVCWESRPGE
jgi:hypothetical protein